MSIILRLLAVLVLSGATWAVTLIFGPGPLGPLPFWVIFLGWAAGMLIIEASGENR